MAADGSTDWAATEPDAAAKMMVSVKQADDLSTTWVRFEIRQIARKTRLREPRRPLPSRMTVLIFGRIQSGDTMKSLGLLARAIVPLALATSALQAQARTSITSLYVTYATRKVTVNPTGELKARLDSVDRDLFAANRVGRTGEVRRLLAKGTSLLAGRPWTDIADYSASLLLRTDRVVVESQKPWTVRLEQLYSPAIELTRSPSAHATLIVRQTGAGASNQPAALVKDLGTFGGVSRDLRESPLALELDLHDVADGRYVVVVDVADSARSLGTASLPIVVRRGIDETVSRLEGEAKHAPEAMRAEILFPVDRMRNVNRGRLELRTLDVDRDFASADAVTPAGKAGRDYFPGRTGDI